jgi:hypothetical protein
MRVLQAVTRTAVTRTAASLTAVMRIAASFTLMSMSLGSQHLTPLHTISAATGTPASMPTALCASTHTSTPASTHENAQWVAQPSADTLSVSCKLARGIAQAADGNACSEVQLVMAHSCKLLSLITSLPRCKSGYSTLRCLTWVQRDMRLRVH